MQKKWISAIIVCLFFISLHGPWTIVHAESFNGNVKECIDQPSKCKDGQQNNNISKNKAKSQEGTGGSIISFLDIVKMIFALLFVIGLLYALLKFINKKSRSYQKNRLIDNIGGTSLGGNKSVQIIKAGKSILVLGVGEDIRLLKEINDEKEVEEYLQQYNAYLEQTLEPKDIVTKLAALLKQDNRQEQKAEEASANFSQILTKHISELKTSRTDMLEKIKKKEQKQDE